MFMTLYPWLCALQDLFQNIDKAITTRTNTGYIANSAISKDNFIVFIITSVFINWFINSMIQELFFFVVDKTKVG